VHAGSIDTRLSAQVLTDPSVEVFFALSAPDGVDVSWGFAPLQASWGRLADPYPVWGWRGPLFEREVSVLDEEWRVDLGPGARPVFEARTPATNGV
jgi:hypothetical protein